MQEYTAVIAMLALIQCIYFSICVGRAREKCGVAAPATTGNADFERAFRVHYNTLEQLVIFIPALFTFSYYVNPLWAQVIGVIYIIGRFVYAQGYMADAKKRGPGMIMTLLSNVVLVIGTIIGVFI
jgi:glutathione S-transferase